MSVLTVSFNSCLLIRPQIMAVVTTVLTPPLLHFVYVRHVPAHTGHSGVLERIKEAEGEDDKLNDDADVGDDSKPPVGEKAREVHHYGANDAHVRRSHSQRSTSSRAGGYGDVILPIGPGSGDTAHRTGSEIMDVPVDHDRDGDYAGVMRVMNTLASHQTVPVRTRVRGSLVVVRRAARGESTSKVTSCAVLAVHVVPPRVVQVNSIGSTSTGVPV